MVTLFYHKGKYKLTAHWQCRKSDYCISLDQIKGADITTGAVFAKQWNYHSVCTCHSLHRAWPALLPSWPWSMMVGCMGFSCLCCRALFFCRPFSLRQPYLLSHPRISQSSTTSSHQVSRICWVGTPAFVTPSTSQRRSAATGNHPPSTEICSPFTGLSFTRT